MKKFISVLCVSLLISSSAFARKVKTKNFTCTELQEKLEVEGKLYVVYGLFGISRGYTYSEDTIDCNVFESAVKTYVRSKDKRRCSLGYRCQ